MNSVQGQRSTSLNPVEFTHELANITVLATITEPALEFPFFHNLFSYFLRQPQRQRLECVSVLKMKTQTDYNNLNI